jgi:CheY-like chemotaxis protein
MSGHKRKILVVEDELDMRMFITMVLSLNGYEPIVAKDGLEGFEKARTLTPDLILLDIMMPNQGGAAMFRKIKEDELLRRIPVCILSGVGLETFLHHLKMVNLGRTEPLPGPEAYLEKPFHERQLIQLIKRHVITPAAS